jgi:hypothetical protein
LCISPTFSIYCSTQLDKNQYIVYNISDEKVVKIMDVNAILQAVGTLGFPIVCAVAMAWYVKYTTDRNREDIDKLNEQHQQEMKEVTTALNNNTLALQKLSDVIGNEANK